MSTYGRSLRKLVLPLMLKRENRGSALYHWQFFEKSQFWPRQRLLDYQWENLKRLLEHAYKHSPYYKQVFDAGGITPASIRSPEDFQKIPLLTRDAIYENFKSIRSTSHQDNEVQSFLTGGTTGQQAKLARDQESFNIKLGMAYRHDGWAGRLPCEKLAVFWPPHMDFQHLESFKMRFKERFLLRELQYYTGLSESGLMERICRDLNRFRPSHLRVFPSALNGFIEFCTNEKLALPEIQAVISTGEPLYETCRNRFAEAFGCDVFDMYGSREVGNTASECGAHDGLHIAMETSYVEFLRNGKPVPEGEEGELVITDLTNFAFPMIRYQINDYGRLLSGACTCGRELQRMSPGIGRLNDDLWKVDGTRVSGITLSVHLHTDFDYGIGQLQITQLRLTDFRVKVSKKPEPTPRVFEFIKNQMKTILGGDIRIHFDVVEEIPREPSGKYRFTKCEFDPDKLFGEPNACTHPDRSMSTSTAGLSIRCGP